MNFYKQVDKVLRYSANTIYNLLEQLQSNHIARRGHFPETENSSNNSHIQDRLVTADALQDELGEHDPQVKLLRNLDQHIIVHKGRVQPARYNVQNILDHMYRAIDERYSPQHYGYPNPPLLAPIFNNVHGILPYGHVSVLKPEANLTIPEPTNYREHIPIHELPHVLASRLETGLTPEQQSPELKAALHNLRNAEVETVDRRHPLLNKHEL